MGVRVPKPSWRLRIFIFICASSLSSADRAPWFWSRDAIKDNNLSCGSIIRPTGGGPEQQEVFRFTFNESPSSKSQWTNENELDTGNRVGGECAVIVVGPTPASRLALKIDAAVVGEYQCLAANALSLYDLGGGGLLLKDTICGLQRTSARMETTGNLALITINLDDIQKGNFILYVSVLPDKHQHPHHLHPMKSGVFLPTFTTPKPAQLQEHFTTGHQTSATSDVFLIPLTTTEPDQLLEKPSGGDSSSTVNFTTSSSKEPSSVYQTTPPQESSTTQHTERTTNVFPFSSAITENYDSTSELQSTSSLSPDTLPETENSSNPLPEIGKPVTIQPTEISGDNEENNLENFKDKTTTISSQTLTSESNNPSRRTVDSGIQFVFTREPTESSTTTNRFLTNRVSRKPGYSGIEFIVTTESDVLSQNSAKLEDSNALIKPNGSGIQFIFTEEFDDSSSNDLPSSTPQEVVRKPSKHGGQLEYPVETMEAIISEGVEPQNLPISITEEPFTTKKLQLRDSRPSDKNFEAIEDDVNGDVSESSIETMAFADDSTPKSSLRQLVVPSKNVSGPSNDELAQATELSVSSSTSTQDITSSSPESDEFTVTEETLEKPNRETAGGSNNTADMYSGNIDLVLTNMAENYSKYPQNGSGVNNIHTNFSTIMSYSSIKSNEQQLNPSTNYNTNREATELNPSSETSGYSFSDMNPRIGNMYGVAIPWKTKLSPNATDTNGIPQNSVTHLFSPVGSTLLLPDDDFTMQSNAPSTSTENFTDQVTDSGTYDEITETSNGENEIDLDYVEEENMTLSFKSSMTTITYTGQTKYDNSGSQAELRSEFPLNIQSKNSRISALQFVTSPEPKDEFTRILSQSSEPNFSNSSEHDERDIDTTRNPVRGETSTKESHTSSTTTWNGLQIVSKNNVDISHGKLKLNPVKVDSTSTKERNTLLKNPEPNVFENSHASNIVKENVHVEKLSNISTTNFSKDTMKDLFPSETFLTSKSVTALKEQLSSSIDNSPMLVKTLNTSVPKFSVIVLETYKRATESSQSKDLRFYQSPSVTPSIIRKNTSASWRLTTTPNLSADTLRQQPTEVDLTTEKAGNPDSYTTNFSTETNDQKLSESLGENSSDEEYLTTDKMFTEDYSIMSTI